MKRLAALLILALAVGFLATRFFVTPKPAVMIEDPSPTAAEAPPFEEPVEAPPPPTAPSAEAEASASAPQVATSEVAHENRVVAAESAAKLDAEARLNQAKANQEVSVKDFLRDELHLTDDEISAYQDIQAKAKDRLEKAREAERGKQRRQAIRGAIRARESSLQELMGSVRYPRYKEYERRQQEEIRNLFRDFPLADRERLRRSGAWSPWGS